MAIQVSPGINVSEIDLTTTTPAISTTEAAIGGVLSWGPVGKYNLIDSENNLVANYGKPTDDNYETFFSAANFLAYSTALYVSRAAVTTGFSSTFSSTLNANTTVTIANPDTDIAIGHGVYGEDVAPGTVVSSVTANATHSIVVLSQNTLDSGSQSINFFDTKYAFNAVANSTTAVTRSSYIIKNSDHFEEVSVPSGVEFVAKYPGDLGNSLKVSVCSSLDQYSSTVNPYSLQVNSTLETNTSVIPGTAGIEISVNELSANVFISNSATLSFSDTYVVAETIRDHFTVGDFIQVGNSSIGTQTLKIKEIGDLANTNPLSPTGETYFNLVLDQPYKLASNYFSNTISRTWEYFNSVSAQPSTSREVQNAGSDAIDQMSVVVVDENGKVSGTPGTILEVFTNLSRVPDAKASDNTSNYFKTAINNGSRYIWATNDIPGSPSANASTVASSASFLPYTKSFVGGTDGITESNASQGALADAYNLYADESELDVSLIIAGKSTGLQNGAQSVNYLVDNIAEVRRDCMVFGSLPSSIVLGSANIGSRASNAKAWADNIRSSSYLFLDNGYKYQYDKYNDVYRYVPLNGDMAGLTARSDDTRDPWWSPAGPNRGHIKNVIRLAWNPTLAERDVLYKANINSVVTFPGQGTMLYGDKTGLKYASAFDRINVRRLFIVLRKSISIAARQFMFEFNDEFTRAQFRNLVEPFLRDIKGRRGIYDFRVVCDTTNNTPQVIDTNRFVGDIYIKPARSISFIQLNFVAVGTGVDFTEVAGSF